MKLFWEIGEECHPPSLLGLRVVKCTRVAFDDTLEVWEFRSCLSYNYEEYHVSNLFQVWEFSIYVSCSL